MKNFVPLNYKQENNEESTIKNGLKALTYSEIKEHIIGKYYLGGYLHGFQFIVAVNEDGSLEGKNNVDHYDIGHWSINEETSTLSVNWQNGWDCTTTRLYDLDGKINMYDSETGLWRTSFNQSIPAVSSIKNYQFKTA